MIKHGKKVKNLLYMFSSFAGLQTQVNSDRKIRKKNDRKTLVGHVDDHNVC